MIPLAPSARLPLDTNVEEDVTQFRMNETHSAVWAPDELRMLLDKHADIASDSKKLARKLPRMIRNNPYHNCLALEIYSCVWDGGIGMQSCNARHKKDARLWDACLSLDGQPADAFFLTLHATMEADIQKLKFLKPSVASTVNLLASHFVIEKCCHIKKPSDVPGVVMKRLNPCGQAMSCHNWKQQLHLSLTSWDAITELRLLVGGMDQFLVRLWRTSHHALKSRDVAFASFEGAMARDGMPFHSVKSPSLGPLLQLLDVCGHDDFRLKFMHDICVVAALLVVHARSFQQQDDPTGIDPIVSAAEPETILSMRLSRPPNPHRIIFFK